ncbi:MAG: hypothetical protein H7A25_17405 [Leptospiraceae bacterium]|nr:hypothetical protein [Leptospiraceae bacterium]MCP5501683.1 hypothetical protein [Leptospiraceae bacterium]
MNFYEKVISSVYNTPIEEFTLSEGFKLSVKRDDYSFASFGSKMRKFEGLRKRLKQENIHTVFLYGNPHSNYLATFTYLFYLSGFKTYLASYSRDSGLITPNSLLVRKYASQYYPCQTPFELLKIRDSHVGENFILDEFGMHEGSLEGLKSIWSEMDSEIEEGSLIVLDVGSGLTALSCLMYPFQNQPEILGVSIGYPVDKMKEYLLTICEKFELQDKVIERLSLIPASISPGYANVNRKLKDFIKETYTRYKFPLEPIYSAKTIYSLLEYRKQISKNIRKVYYLHQGGFLNHISLL